MMSSSERKRQLKLIELQYEELALKWGYDKDDFIKRFEKRLREAKLNKSDINVFFQAENEAIKVFEERLKNYAKEEKINDYQEKDKLETSYADIDQDSHRLYQSIGEKKSSLTDSYHIYPLLKIHEKASAEIEYLFGAMVDFRLMSMPALEEARKFIRDKSFHTMTYEIETLLDEVGNNHNGKLPNIFSVYKLKVAKAKKSDEISRARIDPFKSIVNIARKINRLVRWLENHKDRISPHVHVTYGGEGCTIKTLGEYLMRDIQSIVKNFGLQSFSESYQSS
ncbi:hypothetical protein COTS27_00521 [Spirochaetota bacterium]|nr:hypothetical protein COTS27_00521 [Spirochaetota bacterium]